MINPIGKAKKRRLKKYGSEKDFFAEVWGERPHVCAVCHYPLREPLRNVFSHIYSKGAYPQLRYCKLNLELWCCTILRSDGKQGCHNLWHNNPVKFWARAEMYGWQKPELQYLLSIIN